MDKLCHKYLGGTEITEEELSFSFEGKQLKKMAFEFLELLRYFRL